MVEMLQGIIMVSLESVCCDVFFQAFMKKRFEKRNITNFIIYVMFVSMTYMVATVAQEQLAFKIIGIITSIILFMRILYVGKWLQIIFCSICYYSILFVIDCVTVIILHCMGKGSMAYIINDITNEFLLAIWVRAILFVCIVLINRVFSKKIMYEKLNNSEWIRFIFFPIFTIVAMFFMIFSKNMDNNVCLFMSIGLLISDMLLFSVINDFASRSEENRKESLIREREQNQILTYESMELSYNQQKKKVHEFKNHLDCIQGLLQEHREREALAYIGKINNLTEHHINYFNTLNPVVNVVLNQKYQQAQEDNIIIVAMLDELSGILMKDKDLVVLLSNLLNNAIEACRKLEPEKRMIKFKFTQNNEQILISVRNPINEPVSVVDNKAKTTKACKKEHGIGLCNIEEVIDKYGGDAICSSSHGEFSYTIIFNRKQMCNVH